MRINRLIFLFILCFGLSQQTQAGIAEQQQSLPLDKTSAAKMARTQTNGQVLSVTKESDHGLIYFRVKVLHKDGKVKNYRYEQQSGKLQP
jgi:uncharacterized membrane protein YkoI